MKGEDQISIPSHTICRALSLFLCAMSALLCAPSASAAPRVSTLPPGEGLEVVMAPLWPNLINRAIVESAPRGEALKSVRGTQVMMADPRFSEPLRIELTRVRMREAIPALGECGPSRTSFHDLVQQLESHLDWLQLFQAEQVAEAGWRALPCTERIIDARTLANFFFLNGVLAAYRDRDPRPRFAESLVLEPDFPAPGDYTTSIREAFEAARESVASRSRVKGQLDTAALQGLEVWIDGVRTTGKTDSLLTGNHLVQLRMTDGLILASWLLPVGETPSGSVPILPPGLRLPSREELEVLLRSAVSGQQANLELKHALMAFLSKGNHPWIVLVDAGGAQREARALWVFQGGTETLRTVGCAFPPFCDSRSPVGKALTGGLAIGMVAALGTYGFAYYTANSPTLAEGRTDDEADALVSLQTISRNSALGAGLGMALVASFNWRVPARLYGERNPPPSSSTLTRPNFRPSAGPDAVALQLQVEW